MATIVTKREYARMKQRCPSAISNWIAAGRLTPAALIGSGMRARIWVEQADRDLARRLDPGQQDAQEHPIVADASSSLSNGSSGGLEVVDEVRQARLDQLRLQNQKLAEDAALRAGRYILAADVTRELGRSNAMLMSMWDGWLSELCQTLAGQFSIPFRDVLHATNKCYRDLRTRAAADLRGQAQQVPSLIEDAAAAGAEGDEE
jgi:hypothetical protein